jgi:hypothetical protein
MSAVRICSATRGGTAPGERGMARGSNACWRSVVVTSTSKKTRTPFQQTLGNPVSAMSRDDQPPLYEEISIPHEKVSDQGRDWSREGFRKGC